MRTVRTPKGLRVRRAVFIIEDDQHLAEHAPEALTVLTGVNRLRIAVAQT